ncbi:MAG: DUF885 domain-containing protein [Dehalococcoidia bacterium]
MTRIYEIADEYVERFAALHPVAATGMGVPGHDAEMPDYSPDGAAAIDALARATRDALRAAPIEGEGDRDRIARDSMLERLDLAVDAYEAGEHLRDLAVLGSSLQSIRSTFDLMPRESIEHWANIAARLRLVPQALAGYRTTLRLGLERGTGSTQRQAAECAKQCAVWSGQGDGPPFFESLIEAFDGSDVDDAALRADLESGVQLATAAYAETGTYLREQYLPAAEPRDAVGAERYSFGVRDFLGADLDLDETYRWGWEELGRIQREMEQTAQRITPGEGLQAAAALLDSDPDRAIEGVEPFRRWMQELQETTIAELNGTHFDIPERVQRIEAMISPPGGALAMYYTGPSEDFSRPGRTWYPTGGKTRFPLWVEVSVAYHEGVPGHHLQIATTKHMGEALSRFQRLIGGTSGYVEGWALYAERLMAELGYLENPDYYLGMLTSQAFRAGRVIVDIGLHLERSIPQGADFHPGERWTPELAIEFMDPLMPFDHAFTVSEVDRYLGMPAQAISYKLGERHWLDARARAREAEGGGFDLKQWHAKAFDLGPMGLAQMQRELGGAS